MKAVQREDFDGLAQLLIKSGHLFNFLWVGHKAGVQLLIASVNIGDHQHHEMHGSLSLALFWGAYSGPASFSRLAPANFDADPKICFLELLSKRRVGRRFGERTKTYFFDFSGIFV